MGVQPLPPEDTAGPAPGDPGVEVWRDVEGRVCATGRHDRSGYALFVPNVGMFAFPREPGPISLRPLPGADEVLVDDAYRRIALPLGLQWHGLQVLHASAVRFAGGVVAICGHAGAGKSTLAFALGRAGYRLCGDDAVALDPDGAGFVVPPLPFRMRLRRQSADWFDEPSLLKGREADTAWQRTAPAPLLAVVVLDRLTDVEDDYPRMTRLLRLQAFRVLLPHAYYLTLHDERRNAALVTAYLDLAAGTPVFRLSYVPSLDRLEHMVAVVEKAVGSL